MTSDDLARTLAERCAAFVSSGTRGIQVVVTANGRTVADLALGARVQDDQDVTRDTTFRIFSASKALTGCALHLQVDRGLVSYDDSVTRFIPEFGVNGKDRITVRQLLSHQAGLVDNESRAVSPADFVDWGHGIAKVCAMAPSFEPGTRAEYDGFHAPAIAAELASRVDGRDFVEICHQDIFEPLAMTRTTWRWDPTATAMNEGPEVATFSPAVAALTYALNEPPLRDALLPGGGAFSTATDLARFYNALLGLVPDRPPLLSQSTLAEATRVQAPILADGSGGFGLGFFVGVDHHVAGAVSGVLSPSTFGHPGLSTTYAQADPDSRTVTVILANTIGPTTRKRLIELSELVVRTTDPQRG